ncbi:MAG: Synechococcus phage, partial [Bacteroidota bacterium]
FRRWYIDGRMFYHIVIDEKVPQAGIQEIRYIDPRRIRKIREIQKTKDTKTGMEIIKNQKEYYLYNERGVIGAHSNLGTRIATDAIVNINSGLMDAKRSMVLSYLHKAIKPLNQLRMVEDATVIYRLSRAPERRIFYVDVGNMPTIKAEQYLRDIMVKYRNKLVYDSSTGEIKDDRKHLSMLEDFWLPRREGSKGTEITTLPGGQNLGEMEDVHYFEKKLYKALGVPVSRLEQNQGFSLGRTTEITRDELKFMKFIMRLRNKFSTMFDDLLRVQLVLKRVCTEEEWQEFKEKIWYDYKKDNNFNELKEAELLNNRIMTLTALSPFVGTYFSQAWVKKNVLMLSDEEIEEINAQIDAEGQIAMQQQMQQMQMFGQPQIPGQPPQQQQGQQPQMVEPQAPAPGAAVPEQPPQLQQQSVSKGGRQKKSK